MTRHMVVRHPSSATRRWPLLPSSSAKSSSSSSSLSKTFSTPSAATAGRRRRRGFGEAAGGTAAECAAVCCCCPCAIVGFLVLAVCQFPAGLCRKALKRKRRHMLAKKGLLQPPPLSSSCRCESLAAAAGKVALEPDEDVVRLEKEMWEKFYGAGFWRSPSQKDDIYRHTCVGSDAGVF